MTIGHNSKRVKAGPVNADLLKSFVERIERLEEERKAIGGDIKDVYAEAKGVGYDVGTMRWMVSERKIDAADRDERDTLRDTYALALGMAVNLVEAGMSLRRAEKATGVSKSSIHRALAVPAVSQETALDIPPSPAPESRVGPGTHSETEVLAVPPGGGTGTECGPLPAPAAANTSCGGGEPSAPGSAEGVATTSSGDARVPSGPQDSLTIPSFLDRRVTA